MRKRIYFLGLLAYTAVNPLLAQETVTSTTDDAFSKSNLLANDNSLEEIRPLVSPDGNTLYLSRRSKDKNKEQDVFVVRKDPATGTWGAMEPLNEKLNNDRLNAVASINPSGKELVLFNTYKGTDNVPLVRTTRNRDDEEWTEPEEIYIEEFTNFSPYSDFFVDYTNDVLLMAIDNYESKGEQDLFVAFPQGEEGWSKPVNLGEVVNSEKSDFAPFMGADGRTLFFSSFGHDTNGGSDIFMTVRLDDSWKNWSKPVNLGPEVNTADNENYFSIDKNFKYLYVSSQKEGEDQEGDGIVSVSLPEDFTAINGPVLANLSSEEISKIMDSGKYIINPNGRTTNAEGIAIEGWPKEEVEEVAVTETITMAGEAGPEEVRMEEPAAKEEVEEENLYMPERLRGFQPASEVNELSAEAANLRDFLQESIPDTDLAIRKSGNTTEFKLVQNILYDFNSIYPKGIYHERLNNIARVMREKPDLKVQLIGHTDSIGTEAINEEVARQRVAVVRRYLNDRRVGNDRIEVVGAGQGEPVAPNESDEGRDLNRRVETIIRFSEE